MQIRLNRKTKENYIAAMVENLPQLRDVLGITQAQLAERVGVTRQTLTSIENGSRKLSWKGYLALCFVFSLNNSSKVWLEIQDICPEIIVNYLKVE